jgi:hypothetical protein
VCEGTSAIDFACTAFTAFRRDDACVVAHVLRLEGRDL